jgi:hypothetical protein
MPIEFTNAVFLCTKISIQPEPSFHSKSNIVLSSTGNSILMPGHSSWIHSDFQTASDSKRYHITDNRPPHYLINRVELVENPSALSACQTRRSLRLKREIEGEMLTEETE